MTFSSERRRARDPARRESTIGVDALALVYAEHSRSLLKLAALLVPDIVAAREVVYESFAALNRELRYRDQTYGESRLRSREEVLAFLLRNVVYRARAAVTGGVTSAAPSHGVGDAAVIRAVRALPEDQREALVLRYYGQLSEEQAAAAMGVRTSALRVNVAKGMAELRIVLGPQILAG